WSDITSQPSVERCCLIIARSLVMAGDPSGRGPRATAWRVSAKASAPLKLLAEAMKLRPSVRTITNGERYICLFKKGGKALELKRFKRRRKIPLTFAVTITCPQNVVP